MDTAQCSYRNQKLRELALSLNCMGTKEQKKQNNRIQEQQQDEQQKTMPFTNKDKNVYTIGKNKDNSGKKGGNEKEQHNGESNSKLRERHLEILNI